MRLQPVSEWCHLPGSPGWIPVRGNAQSSTRKCPKYLEHRIAKAQKEIKRVQVVEQILREIKATYTWKQINLVMAEAVLLQDFFLKTEWEVCL